MPLFEGGPLSQWSAYNAGVIPNDVFGIGIEWFVNRDPLLTRLPKLPVGSPVFKVTNDNYRQNSQLMDTNAINTNQGTVGVLDGSMYTPDDVIEIDNEQMIINTITGNSLAVTRGYAGTTNAAHNANSTVYLLGTARTGAAIDVTSVSRIASGVDQYCETFQQAYQVGGALQGDTNWSGPAATPLDKDRMMAVQHTLDDFERTAYYGRGFLMTQANQRQQQKGLRTLIATNNVTAPINGAAYKPDDLIRDTLQRCFDNGGAPSILLVSTDWLGGFAKWGNAAMRIDAGTNVYGAPIELFETPFLPGCVLVPAPLLRSGTVVCLSGAEVRIRMKRPMIDKPRGSRGDAIEGDIIMEGAIELDNESHHAWVQGVTAWAAA